MKELASGHCVPCTGSTPVLTQKQVDSSLQQLPAWVLEEGRLVQDLKVTDFRTALDLVNSIGQIAEDEGHHPDLSIYSWNRVKITLYTHAINGLSQNDFILAARIDCLLTPTD